MLGGIYPRGTITNVSDINTLSGVGLYWISVGTGQGIGSGYGTLLNIPGTGDGGTKQRLQYFWDSNNGVLLYRIYKSGANTWTDWAPNNFGCTTAAGLATLLGFNVYNTYISNPLDLNESPVRGNGSKLIIGTKVLNGIDGANVSWQIYFHFAMISSIEGQIDQQFQIGMYNLNSINNSGDLPKLHIRRYTQNGGGWTNWRPMY